MAQIVHTLESLVVGPLSFVEPGDGIAVLAALVIGLLVLVAGCLMIVFGRRPNSTKKRSNVQVGAVFGFGYQKERVQQ